MKELTAEMIDAMPAGPDMDVLVLTRLFGARKNEIGDWITQSGNVIWPVPKFSTDIAAAFEVNAQVYASLLGKTDLGTLALVQSDTEMWAASYLALILDVEEWWERGVETEYTSRGKTPALAICRAALKATLL